MFLLIALVVRRRKRDLKLKHGVVILTVDHLCQLHGFLVRIKRLVVLVLSRKDLSRLDIELEQHFLVCDLVFGQLKPALGLRVVLLVRSVER